MDKKDWMIVTIIVALIVLVVIFWDKFIIKKEEIIQADYCQVDSDCVLAVNPNLCCIQPIPMNKKAVELDEDYVIYEEGVDYLHNYSKNEQCFSEDGRQIRGCAGFDDHIKTGSLISREIYCENNKCKLQLEIAG